MTTDNFEILDYLKFLQVMYVDIECLKNLHFVFNV